MSRLTLWLRSFPHWVPVGMIALAAAFLSMARCERTRHAEREGELTERLRVLATERDTLRRVAARRDTVYRADTVRLTQATTRWRTVVDSVMRTDTLTVRESVLVAAADTVIRACRNALATCEQRVADRDALIANERRTRATSDSLHRVRLAQANPRIQPYAEARVNPFDSRVFAAEGGLTMRLVGPIRLSGAAEYRSHTDTPFSVLVGARITF